MKLKNISYIVLGSFVAMMNGATLAAMSTTDDISSIEGQVFDGLKTLNAGGAQKNVDVFIKTLEAARDFTNKEPKTYNSLINEINYILENVPAESKLDAIHSVLGLFCFDHRSISPFSKLLEEIDALHSIPNSQDKVLESPVVVSQEVKTSSDISSNISEEDPLLAVINSNIKMGGKEGKIGKILLEIHQKAKDAFSSEYDSFLNEELMPNLNSAPEDARLDMVCSIIGIFCDKHKSEFGNLLKQLDEAAWGNQ